MASTFDLSLTMNELLSPIERVRDLAVESLGDLLEGDKSGDARKLQSIVDALAVAFETESSQVVIESILNTLSHAKTHQRMVSIPFEVIRNRLGELTGSSIEHAACILEETSLDGAKNV